ncbi:glycosyltransferase family 4 protein [Paenibacillus albicereus]|uniref:Glycosyltransferase family 4 protein n=1 Tax=Paenibacillus albicereus TaxID=2726185 RepID=A0A6H2H2X4_9BACL|nr:glycosyltransferase family 4 protein [Paenibacillus albicereus]QJC53766.1 glycosyltransferase family 4 protein [Paenibacillus albicereus]
MTQGIYNFCPHVSYTNEHLMKDCCLIPYTFHTELGWEAVIVTAPGEELTYHGLLPGLQIDFIGQSGDYNNPYVLEEWVAACINYISAHAHKIDFFFCFGPYTSYFSMIDQYKKLRPDGKVILKLDANSTWMDQIPFHQPDHQAFFSRCDLITVESKTLKRYLSKKWPYIIDYVPNGSFKADSLSSKKVRFQDKENVILTVGRLGTAQKATPLLLEAFAQAARLLPDWKLRLVGSWEASFEPYRERYFELHPELRERVTFTGKILDKAILEAEYARAKVFVISSLMEGGTPNVWAEAARNGCYVLCSEIDAVDEATNKGTCGRSFEVGNAAELALAMLDVCRDEHRLSKGCADIQRYQERYFDYKKIVRKMNLLLTISKGAVNHQRD